MLWDWKGRSQDRESPFPRSLFTDSDSVPISTGELRARDANVTLMIQADMLAYHAPNEPPQLGLPVQFVVFRSSAPSSYSAPDHVHAQYRHARSRGASYQISGDIQP